MRNKVLFVVATPMQIISAINILISYKLNADVICLSDHLVDVNTYVKILKRSSYFESIKTQKANIKEKIDFSDYDEIFVTNGIFLITYKREILSSKTKVSIFDEGTMTYLTSFIESCNECCGCRTVYLYEPTLANFYADKKFIIKTIPKIKSDNYMLLKYLNEVFEVETNDYVALSLESLHVFFPNRSNINYP